MEPNVPLACIADSRRVTTNHQRERTGDMDTQFIRRGASALGATALGIMVLAGPALASQDLGDGGGQAATMTSQASKNAADLRDLRQQQGRPPAAPPNPR